MRLVMLITSNYGGTVSPPTLVPDTIAEWRPEVRSLKRREWITRWRLSRDKRWTGLRAGSLVRGSGCFGGEATSASWQEEWDEERRACRWAKFHFSFRPLRGFKYYLIGTKKNVNKTDRMSAPADSTAASIYTVTPNSDKWACLQAAYLMLLCWNYSKKPLKM